LGEGTLQVCVEIILEIGHLMGVRELNAKLVLWRIRSRIPFAIPPVLNDWIQDIFRELPFCNQNLLIVGNNVGSPLIDL